MFLFFVVFRFVVFTNIYIYIIFFFDVKYFVCEVLFFSENNNKKNYGDELILKCWVTIKRSV